MNKNLNLTESEQNQVIAYQAATFAKGDVTEEEAAEQAQKYAEGLVAYRHSLAGAGQEAKTKRHASSTRAAVRKVG
jgi:hypothetical protein